MTIFRNLAVLDAAQSVADEIAELGVVLHRDQMLRSAQSVSANISEAFGRSASETDRNRILRIARGEAEETIRHLQANHRTGRLDPKDYWKLRNRLVTITKMLSSIMRTIPERLSRL